MSGPKVMCRVPFTSRSQTCPPASTKSTWMHVSMSSVMPVVGRNECCVYLMQRGYEGANVVGGMMSWAQTGRPLEYGSGAGGADPTQGTPREPTTWRTTGPGLLPELPYRGTARSRSAPVSTVRGSIDPARRLRPDRISGFDSRPAGGRAAASRPPDDAGRAQSHLRARPGHPRPGPRARRPGLSGP